MEITDRDIEILTWINRHGWITSDLLVKNGTYSHPKSSKRRLRKLANEDYLKSIRQFYNQPKAYWPTYRGANLSKSDLSPPSKPSIQSWQHDLTVIHASIELAQGAGGSWTTERELYSQKVNPISGHLPDGAWTMENGNYVAFEFENSKKGKKRLREIVRDYTQSDFDSVLYFGATETITDWIKDEGRAEKYSNIIVETYTSPVEL